MVTLFSVKPSPRGRPRRNSILESYKTIHQATVREEKRLAVNNWLLHRIDDK